MAEDARQHLQTLGLGPGATAADIKQAYRELAAVWHPDRYTNAPQLREVAQTKMAAINAAYHFLKTYDGKVFNADTPSSTAAGATYRAARSDRYASPRSHTAHPSSDSNVPSLHAVHTLRATFAPFLAVTSLAFAPDGGLIVAAVGHMPSGGTRIPGGR